MTDYQSYITTVREYIHTNYSGILEADSLTEKFWEMYLSDEYGLNPKFFKPTGTFTLDNREYIFTTNLPQAITKVVENQNPILYKQLQEEVFNRTKRLAFISLVQKEKKYDLFPHTISVWKNGSEIHSTVEVVKTIFDKETTFAIISEKIHGRNIFECFFDNQTALPAGIESVPGLFKKMQSLRLPDFLRYNTDYIDQMIDGAQRGANYFKTILDINPSPAFKDNLSTIKANDFTSDPSSVFYPDATPHNFLLHDNVVKLVDLESLGFLHKSFAQAYQTVYFLIHLPFVNAVDFRQLFIDEMRLLASNEELFEKGLLVSFMTHGAKVVEFSSSRQDELLHKNLVTYNAGVAKKLFQGDSVSTALVNIK